MPRSRRARRRWPTAARACGGRPRPARRDRGRASGCSSSPTSARPTTRRARSRRAPRASACSGPSSSSCSRQAPPTEDEQVGRLPPRPRGVRARAAGRRPARRHRRRQGDPVPPPAGRGEPVPRRARDPPRLRRSRSSCGRSCGRSGGPAAWRAWCPTSWRRWSPRSSDVDAPRDAPRRGAGGGRRRRPAVRRADGHRDHGRGPGRRVPGPRAGPAGRLLQHRDERPDAVRPGRRSGERRRSATSRTRSTRPSSGRSPASSPAPTRRASRWRCAASWPAIPPERSSWWASAWTSFRPTPARSTRSGPPSRRRPAEELDALARGGARCARRGDGPRGRGRAARRGPRTSGRRPARAPDGAYTRGHGSPRRGPRRRDRRRRVRHRRDPLGRHRRPARRGPGPADASAAAGPAARTSCAPSARASRSLSGLLDMLKGTVAVLLARALGAGVGSRCWPALAAIVGHSRLAVPRLQGRAGRLGRVRRRARPSARSPRR